MRELKNQKIVITYQGKTATLREWAQLTGKPYHTLYSRYKVNADVDHVFKGVTVSTTATAQQVTV